MKASRCYKTHPTTTKFRGGMNDQVSRHCHLDISRDCVHSALQIARKREAEYASFVGVGNLGYDRSILLLRDNKTT